MWSFDELAETALDAIACADTRLRDENAVRGLDAIEPDALFAPVIAALGNGFDTVEDHPLPTPPGTKRRAKTSSRADLVLQQHRVHLGGEPASSDSASVGAASTLFGDGGPMPGDAATQTSRAIADDALWLTLHACGQFVTRDDVPSPNTRYLTDLVRTPAKRIRALSAAGVDHAGLLLVHFCATEDVARHDLGRAVHRWLDDDLPIRSPVIRVGALDDRIGNAVVAVGAVPVRAIG